MIERKIFDQFTYGSEKKAFSFKPIRQEAITATKPAVPKYTCTGM